MAKVALITWVVLNMMCEIVVARDRGSKIVIAALLAGRDGASGPPECCPSLLLAETEGDERLLQDVHHERQLTAFESRLAACRGRPQADAHNLNLLAE